MPENIDWITPDFKDAIRVLLARKPFDKSITKAVEELNELAAKLLQFINKPQGEVSPESIIEEIVDCEMHFYLLKHYFPVQIKIREQKILKFLNSKDYLAYKNS